VVYPQSESFSKVLADGGFEWGISKFATSDALYLNMDLFGYLSDEAGSVSILLVFLVGLCMKGKTYEIVRR
jgi:hypothetical protein